MQEDILYDISEVSKMLHITSRTLRFYEQQGIIESTTVSPSLRRQYTKEQIAHIKNVLILRTLGLSVRSIAELQRKKVDLKEIVFSKRAEIYASIETHMRELHLLNEAVSMLQSGKNLFDEEWQRPMPLSDEEENVARTCTEAIVSGNNDVLYQHLSERLARYMPRDVYSTVRKDVIAPLGEFVSIDHIVADDGFPNKVYAFVKYQKLGLKVTLVFHNKVVDGLWLGYYEVNE